MRIPRIYKRIRFFIDDINQGWNLAASKFHLPYIPPSFLVAASATQREEARAWAKGGSHFRRTGDVYDDEEESEDRWIRGEGKSSIDLPPPPAVSKESMIYVFLCANMCRWPAARSSGPGDISPSISSAFRAHFAGSRFFEDGRRNAFYFFLQGSSRKGELWKCASMGEAYRPCRVTFVYLAGKSRALRDILGN